MGLYNQPREDRHAGVEVVGNFIRCPDEYEGRPGLFISGLRISPDVCYFEVDLLHLGTTSNIAIGLVPYHYPVAFSPLPGSMGESIAFHLENSTVQLPGKQEAVHVQFQNGDRIGCGVKFDDLYYMMEKSINKVVSVFFTLNGRELLNLSVQMPTTGFHPVIGLCSEGAEVLFVTEVIWRPLENCNSDWKQLHAIKSSGQFLQYQGGHAKDIGFAQGSWPLNTTHYYFEIEIVEAGDLCYIVIGLTEQNYPRHQLPGSSRGSIAYFADNGRLFVECGRGRAFGPQCHKGDIMGCGIHFSEDEADNSDSESEEMGFCADNTPILVFFTLNGRDLGSHEIKYPAGGLFPTVGMLGSKEKVRVELHPLTG